MERQFHQSVLTGVYIMAKNVQIRDTVYNNVPSITVPLASGSGDALFVDTSDATLDNANKMLDSVTSYANGVKYTGNIPSRDSGDLSASGDTVTVPAGNYATQATKSVAAGAVTAPAFITGTSAEVSTGSNTLTLTKEVSVTPNVTTPGYISSGTTGNASVSLTASVPTKAAATITPGTSDVEIAAGTYLTGKQTVAGDSELKPENIVAGKSIFNVAGAVQVPVISQDSTTKVLSIS